MVLLISYIVWKHLRMRRTARGGFKFKLTSPLSLLDGTPKATFTRNCPWSLLPRISVVPAMFNHSRKQRLTLLHALVGSTRKRSLTLSASRRRETLIAFTSLSLADPFQIISKPQIPTSIRIVFRCPDSRSANSRKERLRTLLIFFSYPAIFSLFSRITPRDILFTLSFLKLGNVSAHGRPTACVRARIDVQFADEERSRKR